MTPWRRRLFPRPITQRTFFVVALAAAACAGAAVTVQAQEAVDKAKAAAVDNRMFAGPPGAKAYACFVQRYDANHLAPHPKQKVSAMKLLVSAEDAPEDKTTNYSFRLGVTCRHRSGKFDSRGYCNHAIATTVSAIGAVLAASRANAATEAPPQKRWSITSMTSTRSIS